MLKKDFAKKVKLLEQLLQKEQERSTGHTITNCNIDMTKPDQTKIAIAEAIKEGMKALQILGSIEGNNYGIYLAGNKN